MKKLKTIALLLTAVMALGLFAGCGAGFDASAYVKALLDNSYKNDPTGIVEQKMGTREEAAALYEEGLDAEMAQLTAGTVISKELETAYYDMFADMFGKAKYTVGESEKQEDDSYVVTIKYQKMKVFKPALTAYMEELEAMQAQWMESGEEMPAEDEMVEMVYVLLNECFVEALGGVEYGEEESTTVRVELLDKTYTPNQEDLMKLEMALFDIDALANLE